MKHRRGVSAWAYCLVAVLMASASNLLVASANNTSCATEDVDLCPISQSVKDALSVKRTEGKISMLVFYPGKNALTDDEDTVRIAAELARNHINSMPNILPGYELDLVFRKTQASPSEATWKLVQATTAAKYANITWAMFIGGSSSEATMALGAIANHYYNLTMISFGATSPELSDGDKYPLLYRTIPSEELSNELRLAFIQEYNWTRIAILYQSESIFQKSENDFRTLYENSIDNSSDIPTRSFADDAKPAIDSLLGDESNRIIFAWVNESVGTVLSMAYAIDRVGPRYVWILPGWLNDDWWESENCSGCDWTHVLSQNVFLIDSYGEAREEEKNYSTPTNKTTFQFDEEFKQCLSCACPGEAVDRRRYFMYDAVLAGALALNDSLEMLGVYNMSMNDMSYDNPLCGYTVNESLCNVDFQGVSGRVKFENRNREGLLALYQYVVENGTIVKRLLSLYDVTEDKLKFLPGMEPQWAGGSAPPLDRSIQDVMYLRQPEYAPAVYFFTAIVAAAVLMNIGLFFFNLCTARMKLFAPTAPLINGIIITGCILVLLTTLSVAWVPPVVTDRDNESSRRRIFGAFCNVRMWLFTLGFSLSFGALFAKVWQAYRVYTKPELKAKKLQYWNFFSVLGVFIGLDIVFLCIWTIPVEWRLRHGFLTYTATPEDIVYTQDYCECPNRVFFEGALLVVKALLIIFGFFLAYESRNVQYQYLTDSRYTSFAMFVVVGVFVFFGIPAGGMYFVTSVRELFIPSYVFMNLLVVLATTGGLLTLFIPRFIALAQGKETLLPPQQQVDDVDVDGVEMGVSTLQCSSVQPETSFSETAKSAEAENGSSASSDSGNATLGADGDSRRPSIQTSSNGV